MVTELKTLNEFKTAIASEELVIIDFYAQWCGPCKQIAPKFEELAKKNQTIGFYKIDADNNSLQKVCNLCAISKLPTFCFFLRGEYVTKHTGADMDALIKLIVQYTPRNQSNITKENLIENL